MNKLETSFNKHILSNLSPRGHTVFEHTVHQLAFQRRAVMATPTQFTPIRQNTGFLSFTKTAVNEEMAVISKPLHIYIYTYIHTEFTVTTCRATLARVFPHIQAARCIYCNTIVSKTRIN